MRTLGKAGLIEKARQQPDKVRMVLDKMRTDGVMPTLEAVRNKLDQPLALGYCNVGRVLEGVQALLAERGVVNRDDHPRPLRARLRARRAKSRRLAARSRVVTARQQLRGDQRTGKQQHAEQRQERHEAKRGGLAQPEGDADR